MDNEQQKLILDGQIQDTEKALKKLKEYKDQLELKERQERLPKYWGAAEAIHAATCTYNHTDGCGWGYEEDNGTIQDTWEKQAHRRMLEQVEKACLQFNVSPDDLADLAAKYIKLTKFDKAWQAFKSCR